jgi:ADP-ribose pyrophosphatase YjhB (NUDIX family)
MKGRPKVEIGVIVLNEEGDKILLGFHKLENLWKIPGGRLQYSDDFPECAGRELKKKLNLKVKSERFQKSISFNVLDKRKNHHSIEIDYLLQISTVEEKLIKNNQKSEFDWWVWFEYSELLEEREKFNCGVEVFFNKFKITSLTQINAVFKKFN